MNSAARLLKSARSDAGFTQAELARKVGVSQPVVARLEREGANPRLETLDRVVAATGRSLKLSVEAPPSIDQTMIIADLKLTPEQRLNQFGRAYAFAKSVGGAALSGP